MSKKIVVGYCRAATLVASREETIDGQKTILNRLARKHKLAIDHFYIDFDGKGSSLERPELKKLLKNSKAGKVRVVLVTDLDRIARYADLVVKVLQKLKKYKVRVLANEGYGLVD